MEDGGVFQVEPNSDKFSIDPNEVNLKLYWAGGQLIMNLAIMLHIYVQYQKLKVKCSCLLLIKYYCCWSLFTAHGFVAQVLIVKRSLTDMKPH